MRRIVLAAVAAIAVSTGTAGAADLGATRVAVPAAIAAPVFNWTGFYLGAHVGYGTGTANWTYLPGGATVSPRPAGIFGGGQIGYNWQINQAVLGLEADVSAAGFRSSRACPGAGFTCESRTDFLATFRARAGFAVDRALIYATGGLALGSLKNRTFDTATGALFGTFNQTRVGFAIGAGLEYAVAQNWTVKAEYLYVNFGAGTQAPGATALSRTSDVRIRTDVHTVKIGLNYLFATGRSAVVARY